MPTHIPTHVSIDMSMRISSPIQAPAEWWRAKSAAKFLNHNIIQETAMYDRSFRCCPACTISLLWHLAIVI